MDFEFLIEYLSYFFNHFVLAYFNAALPLYRILYFLKYRLWLTFWVSLQLTYLFPNLLFCLKCVEHMHEVLNIFTKMFFVLSHY